MRADNTHHLRQASRDRHESTVARAEQALCQLDRGGQPVTFRAVAAAARVSRAWLYRQPDLRATIERLRAENAQLREQAPRPRRHRRPRNLALAVPRRTTRPACSTRRRR